MSEGKSRHQAEIGRGTDDRGNGERMIVELTREKGGGRQGR